MGENKGKGVSRRKIIIRVTLVLITLAALFVLVGVPWFITSVVTTRRFNFPDSDLGKTPTIHQLAFDEIEFPTQDGITIRGWYIPAGSEADGSPSGSKAKGTVVFCHGMNRSRVEFLEQSAFVHRLGYHALLFDFRHQGASDGELTTLGYQERFDVLAAVEYARERSRFGPVIVWGISMGGAATLMAAADSTEIDAAIVDSTFLSLEDTIAHHLKLIFKIPKYPTAQTITHAIAWKGGFRASDFDLRKAVERIGPRPILFVAVEDDRRMPSEISRKLHQQALSPDKALLIVPGKRHGGAYQDNRETYEEAVRKFLRQVAGPEIPDEPASGEPGSGSDQAENSSQQN